LVLDCRITIFGNAVLGGSIPTVPLIDYISVKGFFYIKTVNLVDITASTHIVTH